MPNLIETVSYLARGAITRRRVLLAQIVPLRYCNLSCAYCNEFDKDSKPVPLEEVKLWIDKLAEFRTLNVTVSGGEPMKHPQIMGIIRHIRDRGMMAGLITNGYFLTRGTVEELNNAGLQDLQISIDNIERDRVSGKSLNYYLKRKTLRTLEESARFKVNINSVIGAEGSDPEDALRITRIAREHGFSSTVGIIHDGDGLIRELSGREREVYEEIVRITGWHPLQYGYHSKGFQRELLETGVSDWKCRAGARYLYVCEHGRVQWCSQHRVCKGGGEHDAPIASADLLDVSVADFTREIFDRQFATEKWCAPGCTIQCVRLVGHFDRWRR